MDIVRESGEGGRWGSKERKKKEAWLIYNTHRYVSHEENNYQISQTYTNNNGYK